MRRLLILLLALTCIVGANSASVAETWTLSGNSSSMAPNPNGAWSYGVYLEDSYNSSLGPFYVWPTDRIWSGTSNLYYYANPDDLSCGAIFHNPTSTAFVTGNQWLLPGDVCLHPGTLQDFYSPVIRWTAPADMTVLVNAVFAGHDPASTGVHILLDGDMSNGAVYTGTHLFDGIVDGNIGCPELGIAQTGTAPSQTYTDTIALTAGQYIDFTVDPQGWYGGDMTGLAVTITTVPEPATSSLLGCTLIGLLAVVWRKRK